MILRSMTALSSTSIVWESELISFELLVMIETLQIALAPNKQRVTRESLRLCFWPDKTLTWGDVTSSQNSDYELLFRVVMFVQCNAMLSKQPKKLMNIWQSLEMLQCAESRCIVSVFQHTYLSLHILGEIPCLIDGTFGRITERIAAGSLLAMNSSACLEPITKKSLPSGNVSWKSIGIILVRHSCNWVARFVCGMCADSSISSFSLKSTFRIYNCRL